MIKRETKKNILDHFEKEEIYFSGRMNNLDFLERLYDLKKMASSDPRFEDAAGDIWQHAVNNNDYEGNWVFKDRRFQLLEGDNEVFLRFVCEMAHPLVSCSYENTNKIITIANDWLREDGWEFYPVREIAGGQVFSFRQTNAIHNPKEEEIAHIWELNKLRFFISHRDKHKVEAKTLSEELKKYGISSFVAHDSIQAMSTWKNEIMKALQTMEACVCYITNDFYESEWTNQEIGYALARGVPIYLYSVDMTDPKGFKIDTQAIKTGFDELINCIKRDFLSDNKFKESFIETFVQAINGTFDGAKNAFYELVDFKFNNTEIDKIVAAFSAKAKYANQLNAVLIDPIKEEHKKNPRLRKYKYYREYLNNDIFGLCSPARYEVRVSMQEQGSEKVTIVDRQNIK